jgi:uncharacterized membrane protein
MVQKDPIDDPQNYKFGVFYFNRTDTRVVVPKRSRILGYSLNFANWKSYVFMLLLILAASYFIYFKNNIVKA